MVSLITAMFDAWVAGTLIVFLGLLLLNYVYVPIAKKLHIL